MPNITIEGPKLDDIEKKREMVKKITDSVEKGYGISREHIVVTIKENKLENVSVGGVLIADRKKDK